MADRRWYRRMLGFGLLGLVAMTLSMPAVMLARGTTGHDWYAASRLTLEELKLAVGFNEFAPVAYRRAYGDVWNISRFVFVEFGPAQEARGRILSAAGDGLMLGAGVGGTVFVLMAFGAAGALRRGSRATVPAPAVRSWQDGRTVSRGTVERLAGRLGGRARVALLVVPEDDFEALAVSDGAVDVAALPAAGGRALARSEARSAPDVASAPADRLPVPRPAAPARPIPAGPQRGGRDAGKADSGGEASSKPPAAVSAGRPLARASGAPGKKPRPRIY